MIERFFAAACAFAVVASVLLFPAHAQFSGNRAALPLITGTVDESNLVRLLGNVRPEVNAANDLGPVPADFRWSTYSFSSSGRPRRKRP
jgi:hypothetical protein